MILSFFQRKWPHLSTSSTSMWHSRHWINYCLIMMPCTSTGNTPGVVAFNQGISIHLPPGRSLVWATFHAWRLQMSWWFYGSCPDCRARGQEPCKASCVLCPRWSLHPEFYFKAFLLHLFFRLLSPLPGNSDVPLFWYLKPACPSCQHRPAFFGRVFMTSFVISFKVLVSVEALSYSFHYHESQVDPGCPRSGKQTS